MISENCSEAAGTQYAGDLERLPDGVTLEVDRVSFQYVHFELGSTLLPAGQLVAIIAQWFRQIDFLEVIKVSSPASGESC
jgi:hypothetical protein